MSKYVIASSMSMAHNVFENTDLMGLGLDKKLPNKKRCYPLRLSSSFRKFIYIGERSLLIFLNEILNSSASSNYIASIMF